jgi:fucose permease
MRSTSPKLRPTWIGIALSFYAFIAIGIAEGGLGVLLPSILQTYQLTPATVTALFITQVGGYMVAALTSSLLSSRLSLARMLVLASIFLTSAVSLYAFTTHWTIMVASGLLLGLGIGLIDAGINTYIASDQENANIMGILHGFYGIGALLGPTLATALLTIGFGWRQIYGVIAGIVSLTIVGMSWAVIHRYTPMTRKPNPAGASARSHLKTALRSPIVLASAFLLFLYTGLEASMGNWAYTVQTVSRGTPTWIAGYSISGFWFGLTIGRLIMGRLIRFFGAIRTIDGSVTLLFLGLLGWWLLPHQWITLPLIGFALAAIFPATIWLMPQRIPSTIVPAAIGFLTSVASLGAASIPTAIGWIANQTSIGIIPVLLVPLAILLLSLHRWLVQQKIPMDNQA